MLRLKFDLYGEALILALRQIHWPSVDPGRLKRKLSVTDDRPVEADGKTVAKSAQRIVPSSVRLGTFRLPYGGFSPGFFPTVKANVRVHYKYGARPALLLRRGSFAIVSAQNLMTSACYSDLHCCHGKFICDFSRKPTNFFYSVLTLEFPATL